MRPLRTSGSSGTQKGHESASHGFRNSLPKCLQHQTCRGTRHHEKLPLDNPNRHRRHCTDRSTGNLRHRRTSPRNTHRRHPARGFRPHRHDDRTLHNRRGLDIHRNSSPDRKGVPPQTSRQRLNHTSPQQAARNQKEQPAKNNSPPGFKSQPVNTRKEKTG